MATVAASAVLPVVSGADAPQVDRVAVTRLDPLSRRSQPLAQQRLARCLHLPRNNTPRITKISPCKPLSVSWTHLPHFLRSTSVSLSICLDCTRYLRMLSRFP